MNILRLFAALLSLLVALPTTATAADSYGNCTGFIDTLPATITSQGVWCLRSDLTTSIASGSALTLANNNITLDCNGHRIDGRAAGIASDAIGVQVPAGRLNAVVRQCAVRGFRTGVRVEGGGHRVEHNRVSAASLTGIHAEGDGIVIRANQVSRLVGRPGPAPLTGVLAVGEGVRVIDNDISHLEAYWQMGGPAFGIHIEHGIAAGNRISVLQGSSLDANGIHLVQAVARDNRISMGWFDGNTSIAGDGESSSVCKGNLIWGLVQAPMGCAASDNVVSVEAGG